MIFIGFGFLITYLGKYGFSAVGYNFLIAAFGIQWAILMNGAIHGAFHDYPANCRGSGSAINTTYWCIQLDTQSLIKADFATGAVLISFGAVLGKTSPMQMLLVATLELVLYALNENACINLGAVDLGGAMFVHTFGAYFGLALSWTISTSKNGARFCEGKTEHTHKSDVRSYNSNMFAMVGTIFLWVFWPSFNAALTTDTQAQQRIVVNTVLALAACCVTAFALDNLLEQHHKFNMKTIQNATLAGGVVVASGIVSTPRWCVMFGMIAAAISVLGSHFIQPVLEVAGLHDTRGVHNVHGMPGIMGAIIGALTASFATDLDTASDVQIEEGKQMRHQLYALFVTLALSLGGGLVTGLIIKSPCFLYEGRVKDQKTRAFASACCNFGHSSDKRIWFQDIYYWHVPDEREVDSGESDFEASDSDHEDEFDIGVMNEIIDGVDEHDTEE